MLKHWQILPEISQELSSQLAHLPGLVRQLLFNRGLTDRRAIESFLEPDYSRDIHDPFLFRDMKKAAERIFQAIEKNEMIVIHGDYDADGVCATVILETALRTVGAKHLDVFLPDRELEGYGLIKDTMDLLASAGAKLLITCDCGISNKAEVERANELGLEVIITDHHNVPAPPAGGPPPAFAIIHPKVPGETYPDKTLSGGGVAFKLAQALFKEQGVRNKEQMKKGIEGEEKWLLDLAAISSVADMVPLLGETRTLVKYGLIVLNKTKRLGLQNLIEVAGLNKNSKPYTLNPIPYNLNTHSIGFQLAPRLNAAGRIQHANTAYQLLTATDPTQAKELARELNANNQERQKITERMTAEAEDIIKRENQENQPVLFVLKENWPLGLVGLVASRLCDRYYRPAIVMTKKDGRIHGSGRSIDEINIMEKMEKLQDYFEKFGGHPQACGFTLKNDTDDADKYADDADYTDIYLKKFKTGMIKLIKEEIGDKKLKPVILIDAEVNLDEVDWKLYDLLLKFEPFGEANSEPKYLAKNLTVVQAQGVGADCKHLKLLVKHNNDKIHKLIGFGFGDENRAGANWCQILKPGDKIDVVFELSANEWNGERELQLKMADLHYHTDDANNYADDADYADKIVNDAKKYADNLGEDKILIYGDLTYKINGILFEIHNQLGKYCNEQQVCDAIEEKLKQNTIHYEREKILPESFKGERPGRNRIDFLIDNKVILEIKMKNFIGKEEYYQCLRYLEALDKKLCLLINFRSKYLRVKRIINPKAKI